jgi:hypothetical protein
MAEVSKDVEKVPFPLFGDNVASAGLPGPNNFANPQMHQVAATPLTPTVHPHELQQPNHGSRSQELDTILLPSNDVDDPENDVPCTNSSKRPSCEAKFASSTAATNYAGGATSCIEQSFVSNEKNTDRNPDWLLARSSDEARHLEGP